MADQVIQQTTQNQVGFAPEVAPYAQNLLGTAAGVAYQYKKDDAGNVMMDEKGLPIISGFQPYMPYQGERVAQFSPLQKQSFEGAQQMQPAYQLQGATGLAGMAGQQALNTSYTPSNFRSQSILGNRGGMGGQNTLQQYMSPYVQNVIQRQQQDASRQAATAAQTQQAQAARMGAFGGSGDYLMRGQAARELARQKGDIMATGMQNAYGQAMAQFNQEQQARQQAAQLREQSNQYGAGLGLQGLQTALTGANALTNIGQNQYTQGMGINQLQNQYGTQQQGQMNTILGNQYQDYLNQQNQPYKQLGFMSDIIRGTPLSQQGSTIYSTPPSAISQIAGLGGAAITGAKLFGASGGATKDLKKRPAGLADLAIYNMG